MKAYWYDNEAGDQREAHDSGREVSAEHLAKLGVLYYHLPDEGAVEALAAARHYRNRDVITVSRASMGAAYEAKVRMFFQEHLHEDEEIRYVRDGRGYFDVRAEGDAWLRIRMERDDLIILPAGIYHRFTTDADNYIVAMRLFKDEPKWEAKNRDPEVDANPYRKEYLQSIQS